MAHEARNMWISRRRWLLAGLAIPLFRARAAGHFSVSFDGDNLYPVAPTLDFLAGKPLARLKGGDTVRYASRLTLFSDEGGTVLRQKVSQFIVSYSLWDENFQVTIPGSPTRTQPGLTMAAAESLCLDSIWISASGLPPDRPFWLKFELRTVREKDYLAVLADSKISLSAPLIELFSRNANGSDERWSFSIDRLRLADLPRPLSRRAHFE